MRKLLLLLLLLLLAISSVTAQDATATPAQTPMTGDETAIEAGTYSLAIRNTGMNRAIHFYIPTAYAEREGALPLVVVLHGIGSSGVAIEAISQFNELADEENFMVVYLNGYRNTWNDGRGDREIINVDDVGYIEDTINFMIEDDLLDIDPSRVYIVGYSIGGMMALRAGCTLNTTIAGIGVISATMPIFLTNLCNAAGGVPVMMIAGTEDPFVPYEGLPEGYLSAEESIDYWRRNNICGTNPEIDETFDEVEEDETSIERIVFPTCLFGNGFAFYTVVGGGHTYPGHPFDAPIDLGVTTEEINATEVVWDFLKDYSLDVETESGDD